MINRLIIIGNGFDLAHGLKTKYSDFMEDYYLSIIDSGKWNDDYFECDLQGYLFKNCSNLDSILDYLRKSTGYSVKEYAHKINLHGNKSIKIKNSFFYKISKSHSIQNWVDIENEYFKSLLFIIDQASKNLATEIEIETAVLNGITKLNLEMDAIALKFEEYLKTKVQPFITNDEAPVKDLLDDYVNYTGNGIQYFAREFPKKYTDKNKFFVEDDLRPAFLNLFNQTMVLNFNYTSTFEYKYRSKIQNIEIINIHGMVGNKRNPINLGFGDEMSKRYGEIEDFNENEYLRLMKSFFYSDNNNYKKLFDFIEGADFQVQIMGHSCGTSDRTLLNAIFENHNCKSIKIFYHEREKDGETKDNFSDIVRNISRHFNQKTMMREKIVNKDYTEPLIRAY
ncbi:AbiH family protein [Flavobacterium macacae]|uniref:Bacteriophage abortive infection AbiH n=1 Tax=Flavobacterium macacae TaxID=2488993 RepID=A0A3P3VZ62_9FLAO|nr:AbiH family protein [Flavobacterium macacae]RRJ87784.1 hypothetical protein EG849_15075 [Flavobacterium macacae]